MENKSLKPYERLLILVTPVLIILLTTHTPNDNDMWWHLSAGNWMLQNKAILTSDIFSYTKYGTLWVNAFWISEIFFSIIYKYFGFIGLALTASIIILLSLLIIKKQLQIPAIYISLPLLIAAFGLSPFSGVRPQLFSFLFLAILDYFLYLYKKTDAQPAYLIILFIIWANLHGGFVWGILLLLAYISGEIISRLRKEAEALPWRKINNLLLFSLFAVLCTIINPNGYLLWILPFKTVQVSIAGINEWASPDFHRIDFQPSIWFIFILIICLGVSKQKLSITNIIKILGFSFMGFVSQRSLAPFLIISTPIISNSLFQLRKEINENNEQLSYQKFVVNKFPLLTNIINYTVTGFLILVTLFQLTNVSSVIKINNGYPSRAVEWIEKNELHGNLFNSYNWGGYLTNKIPDHPVFIDGRADLYGSKLINEWYQIANGTKTGIQLLDTWNIKIVLIELNSPLTEKLENLGWNLYFRDETSVILGRNQ